MTFLLNHPLASPLLALIAAVVVTLDRDVFTFLNSIYAANASAMVGVSFSLLGFVIAALAIIISVFDRGLFKHIAHGKNLGQQLIQVFSNTSKILWFFGFGFLLLTDFAVSCQSVTLQMIYAAGITFALIISAIQVAKIIYVLEKAAFLANNSDTTS